ncbi:hypothetical protein PLEOSDRAFT_1105655 [Pleurotus ostreatus PC15]|uniref:DNA polymerase n=1 Tax=Pleurotus ostreatus (strain PC15) TaxID=1137138 RepID=A0A067NFY1_PLEO1|nr:hypothetical protein PLEOSDRAFT_1105655 [Pleurotus ostreatus PC15]
MERRSRRGEKTKEEIRQEYLRVRAGGRRQLKDYEDKIYDEVSEDQYKAVVKGRLQEDDFVVDDGVGGYVDNGMDEYGQEDEFVSDVEEKRVDKKRKPKKDIRKAKPAPPPPAAPSISAYRPAVTAEQENDLMASLLGSMDAFPIMTPSKPRKRKPEPAFSSYPARPYDEASSDYYSDGPLGASSDDFPMSPAKRIKTDAPDMTPDVDKLAELNVHSDYDFSDVDMDQFMDMDDLEEEIKPVVKRKTAQNAAKKEETINASWMSFRDNLNVVDESPTKASSSTNKHSDISALESDGSLRFYWLDYVEQAGRVYLVGKLRDKASGGWVSCCVTVENLERNLYVLPREKRAEYVDGDLVETDELTDLDDVYTDFDYVRKQMKIKTWKGKFVNRNYVFGKPGVPRETKWLKVVYPSTEPEIPSSACSANISCVLGTSTSAFELLVIKRKIMGPCWLEIKNPQVDNKGVSWCKFEATVSDPKDLNPFSESDSEAPKDIPPLTVMSLSLRTIVNHRDNKCEIVCATARIWKSMDIDDQTPPEQQPCSVHTFVRPLDGFPPNFEQKARENPKCLITSVKNERMLLNSLLVTIYKADPDVIVGHDFLGVSLDVLLNRMKELKADHWSRIGRFRRSKWPSIGRQGSNLRFLNGRMLCDLSGDGAKGLIMSTTWSLTELCKTFLKVDRQDIDPDDTAGYFDSSVSSSDRLLTFVRHCEMDSHFQMAIAMDVQMLPLTKQLTNLAGNSWNKTLNGGRAERNEYILLHEFHRLKYICPDKWGQKNAPAPPKEPELDENGQPIKAKKDTYKGGLVFEPKRGLWDRYILVMDFNSLYPSIIQEYNIDFTTVDENAESKNEDGVPEPPPPGTTQGVLPRLIATLVNRRRQVKALMKDRNVPQHKRVQYDIKQMALKLTANSMYGCLGFEHSRFYAKPLAALTTHMGREILMQTKALAENLGLEVVYGDTDSIFVNSNETEYEKAIAISFQLKRAVNDKYKLLEIDLDSVFERLLLLQKKKYAALKVEDKTRRVVEVKGLDMKRREYCQLSKDVSQYLLDQILSGEPTEIVVDKIHEYLTTMGENIRGGRVKVDDFIIFKRLGKNPDDYNDATAKTLPHVHVAKKMKSKGGSARMGDVIPYIFCREIGDVDGNPSTSQAERAKHPDDLRKDESTLIIDYEYYIAHQILPPIQRLCEHIEGTDKSRLAESLGLDPNRYSYSQTQMGEGGMEAAFSPLDAQISDQERYKDATPFMVKCRGCKGQVAYAPMYERSASILQPAGPSCPACSFTFSIPSLLCQLEHQIRAHISKYYEGWLVCDDPTCDNRTRMMSVYGKRCLRSGCRGNVGFEYSDAALYNQLRYYAFLFDSKKALQAAPKSIKQDELKNLAATNAEFLFIMGEVVEKYLDQCGRRWVELDKLFSFMRM